VYSLRRRSQRRFLWFYRPAFIGCPKNGSRLQVDKCNISANGSCRLRWSFDRMGKMNLTLCSSASVGLHFLAGDFEAPGRGDSCCAKQHPVGHAIKTAIATAGLFLFGAISHATAVEPVLCELGLCESPRDFFTQAIAFTPFSGTKPFDTGQTAGGLASASQPTVVWFDPQNFTYRLASSVDDLPANTLITQFGLSKASVELLPGHLWPDNIQMHAAGARLK
jgi:hypothetical protein